MRSLDPPRRALAVALAGLAGFVDATAFLAAGGYFASFMSGNTTRLGVDFAVSPASALVPLGLIAGFVAGVTLGALVADRAGGRRKTSVLLLASALLALATAFDRTWQLGFLAATVMAMGALNNVFRRDGEVAVGVTYMTGALVRLGQGLAARLSGRPTEGRLSAALLWIGLAGGAIVGALVYSHARNLSMPVALVLAGFLTAGAWGIERAGDQRAS
jgi:uncharacterized membrane protein YoaK (UPF0700 family)